MGLLPPSDSEDSEEDEPVAPTKTKQVGMLCCTRQIELLLHYHLSKQKDDNDCNISLTKGIYHCFLQAATAGMMPPSDSEEEGSSEEESDSEEEQQPVRRGKPAVPEEPPRRY